MRDDLHHSLPQTSPWRAAVKAVCAPGLGGTLADAIERAVWSSGGAWVSTAWGQEFKSLLSTAQSDFFGQERLERGLEKLERSCTDHFARGACEIARAAIANEELGPGLYKHVVHAVLYAHAEDCIEHAAARIEADNSQYQAREVRRIMITVLPNCNFSETPAPKSRQRRKTVGEGLSMVLPYRD